MPNYETSDPIPSKFLMPDGSMVTHRGELVAGPDADRALRYVRSDASPNKYLNPDGKVSTLPDSQRIALPRSACRGADAEARLMQTVTVRELVNLYPFRSVSWRRWLASGLLPGARKVGREWMIPVDEAEALMDKRSASDLCEQYVAGLDRERCSGSAGLAIVRSVRSRPSPRCMPKRRRRPRLVNVSLSWGIFPELLKPSTAEGPRSSWASSLSRRGEAVEPTPPAGRA